MSGVNKAIVVGFLGGPPAMRATAAGARVATLSVATSTEWRDKATGEKKEKTEWHRVVVFNEGLAKVAEQFLKKGSRVYVEGAMQTRRWTDAKGVERFTTEVVLGAFGAQLVLLDRRESSTPPPADSADSYGGGDAAPAPPDDEIPF